MADPKRRIQRIAASFNAKARRLHVPGVVSWRMLASMKSSCAYCGTGLRLEEGTWDHVLAFDRGGTNEITNIVRCCTDCQRAKFTKTPEEFAAHRYLRVECKRPTCDKGPNGTRRIFKPRWAEYMAGRARYCSHECAGAAKGQDW